MFPTAVSTFMAMLLIASVTQAQLREQPCIRKNTVTVTGAGSRSFNNTIAVVRLRISANGSTPIAVQAILSANTSKLVAFLQSQRVQRLRTSGLTINAQFNFRVSPPLRTGYIGSNTVSFEVPIARTGAILDGSLRNGASEISTVNFRGSAADTTSARKFAIVEAVKNARKEAEAAVGALGKSVGRPLGLRVIDVFRPQLSGSAFTGFQADTSAGFGGGSGFRGIPIVGGEQSVQATVAVTFFLY